MIRKLK